MLDKSGILRRLALSSAAAKRELSPLRHVDGVKIVGHPKRRAGVISIAADGAKPLDMAGFLDKYGIALRSGTHCAQPLLNTLDIRGTLRISPAFYNTAEEVDIFINKLRVVLGLLRGVSAEH